MTVPQRSILLRLALPLAALLAASSPQAAEGAAAPRASLLGPPASDTVGPVPTVGIQGRYLSSEQVADLLNLSIAGGAMLVERVSPNSPASRAGLHGGDLDATIKGDPVLLGGDLIVQLEVHKSCAGECLLNAPAELSSLEWIGVTYMRKGKVQRTVIDVSAPAADGIDPVSPDVDLHSIAPWESP